MQFIFLQGQKHSGDHVLVQWLGALAGGVAHCNNYFYKIDEDLDRADHGLAEVPFEDQLKMSLDYIASMKLPLGLISFEYPGRLPTAQVARIFEAAQARLSPSTCFHLQILRDPFNWMASYARLKAGVKLHGVGSEETATFEETRANYARFHEDYWLRWLRAYRLWILLAEPFRIDYGRLVAFVEYRRALASAFGLPWSDRVDADAVASVPAQGSSFGESGEGLVEAVAQRYEFALPLFAEFGIPAAVWQCAALVYPQVTQAVRLRLERDRG